MKKNYLLTPGPAPVPDDVISEMARPIIHHRKPEYIEITKSVNEELKKVFKTKNNVLTFTSSGTGAMEASVVNTLSKGDTAIVVRGGKFGERFDEICHAYGVNVVPLDIKWGTGPKASLIEETLKANPETKAVFMQLCETSTATVYDVKSIGDVVKETSAILIVDVISGLGADRFDMDGWNVDIAVGGSQKGFMIPPGLSFCAASKKAWGMIAKSTLPKFYFDFRKYEKLMEKFDNPFTPAITLVIGLRKALSTITEKGVDNFIKMHEENAEFLRKSVKGVGFGVFSKSPSNAVTAINVPAGIDASVIIKALKERDITVADGQGELKGKIFRIAHMGAITRKDLEFVLKNLKEILKEVKV